MRARRARGRRARAGVVVLCFVSVEFYILLLFGGKERQDGEVRGRELRGVGMSRVRGGKVSMWGVNDIFGKKKKNPYHNPRYLARTGQKRTS